MIVGLCQGRMTALRTLHLVPIETLFFKRIDFLVYKAA